MTLEFIEKLHTFITKKLEHLPKEFGDVPGFIPALKEIKVATQGLYHTSFDCRIVDISAFESIITKILEMEHSMMDIFITHHVRFEPTHIQTIKDIFTGFNAVFQGLYWYIVGRDTDECVERILSALYHDDISLAQYLVGIGSSDNVQHLNDGWESLFDAIIDGIQKNRLPSAINILANHLEKNSVLTEEAKKLRHKLEDKLPAPFYPMLWFDASDGKTIEASTDNKVARWRSKGRMELDLEGSDEHKLPILIPNAINNKSSVKFTAIDLDDTGTFLYLGDGTKIETPFTIVAIAQSEFNSRGAVVGITKDHNSIHGIGLTTDESGTQFSIGNFRNEKLIDNILIHDFEEYNLIVDVAAEKKYQLIVNKATSGEQNFEVESVSGDNLVLGFSSNTAIAEVLIYGRALSDEKIAELRQYLEQKYGGEFPIRVGAPTLTITNPAAGAEIKNGTLKLEATIAPVPENIEDYEFEWTITQEETKEQSNDEKVPRTPPHRDMVNSMQEELEPHKIPPREKEEIDRMLEPD